MLSQETKDSLLKKIQLAEKQLSTDKSLSPLYNLEASCTLTQLKHALSHAHLRSSKLSNILTTILNRRWQYLQSMNIGYLHDFTNPANILCIDIARELGRLSEKSYLTLLMPNLAGIDASDYTSSSYDDDLDLKDIVLSDCGMRIIEKPRGQVF